MDGLPTDIADAMYPVFEEEQKTSAPSASGGIAYVGTSTRLIDVQHRLCSESGMGALESPVLGGSFPAMVTALKTWASSANPSVILFDDAHLAAALAQVMQRPLLRAKQIAYDAELGRVRTSAPLYGTLMTQEAVAKELPQIVLIS